MFLPKCVRCEGATASLRLLETFLDIKYNIPLSLIFLIYISWKLKELSNLISAFGNFAPGLSNLNFRFNLRFRTPRNEHNTRNLTSSARKNLLTALIWFVCKSAWNLDWILEWQLGLAL